MVFRRSSLEIFFVIELWQVRLAMLFKSRIKDVIDIEEIEKQRGDAEPEELEKGDFAAMLIAAAVIIGPIVLGMIGLMFLLGWLFGAFRL